MKTKPKMKNKHQVYKGKKVPLLQHNYHNLKAKSKADQVKSKSFSTELEEDPEDEAYFKERRNRSLVLYRTGPPKAKKTPIAFDPQKTHENKKIEKMIKSRKLMSLIEYRQKNNLMRMRSRIEGRGLHLFDLGKPLNDPKKNAKRVRRLNQNGFRVLETLSKESLNNNSSATGEESVGSLNKKGKLITLIQSISIKNPALEETLTLAFIFSPI